MAPSRFGEQREALILSEGYSFGAAPSWTRRAFHFQRTPPHALSLPARVRGSMLPRVWHLHLPRAEARVLAAWLSAGTFDLPADARAGPKAGDYVFLHHEAGAVAAGRVLARPEGEGRLTMRWARFPRPARIQGVPRGAGLRIARAFAWEQKRIADSILDS